MLGLQLTALYVPAASGLGTISDLAASAGDAQVDLTWSDVSGETGYDVHRSTTSPVPEDGTAKITASSLAAGTTSYTDTGLTNGTTYYYKVSATDGTSTTYSNEASATPAAAATAKAYYYREMVMA